MRRLKALATIGALAILTTGCGAGDTGEAGERDDVVATLEGQGVDAAMAAELGDLYEKALEGDRTINFYGLAALPLEDTFKIFEDTFPGLDVVGTQLNSPDTLTKITAEETSGRVSVGVMSGVVEAVGVLDKDGHLDDFTPLNAENLSDVAVDPGGFYAYALTPWGAVYPSDLAADKVPTSWKKLIGEGYDGSVAAVDPKVTGLTSGLLTYLLDTGAITEQDVQVFGGSGYTPYADSGAMTAAVGTGDKDLSLANSYSVFAAQKDAGGFDLEFAFPMEDVNIIQPLLLALPKGAPNRAGAELLLNFLFTQAAQEAAAAGGYLPVLEGVDSEVFPSLDEIPNPIPGPRSDDVLAVYGEWASVLEGAL